MQICQLGPDCKLAWLSLPDQPCHAPLSRATLQHPQTTAKMAAFAMLVAMVVSAPPEPRSMDPLPVVEQMAPLPLVKDPPSLPPMERAEALEARREYPETTLILNTVRDRGTDTWDRLAEMCESKTRATFFAPVTSFLMLLSDQPQFSYRSRHLHCPRSSRRCRRHVWPTDDGL